MTPENRHLLQLWTHFEVETLAAVAAAAAAWALGLAAPAAVTALEQAAAAEKALALAPRGQCMVGVQLVWVPVVLVQSSLLGQLSWTTVVVVQSWPPDWKGWVVVDQS